MGRRTHHRHTVIGTDERPPAILPGRFGAVGSEVWLESSTAKVRFRPSARCPARDGILSNREIRLLLQLALELSFTSACVSVGETETSGQVRSA